MNGRTEEHDPEFVQKETSEVTVKKVTDFWLKPDSKSADPILPKL